MTYHPGKPQVRYLRNGDARLTTHAMWTAYAEILSERRPFKTGGALFGERVNGGSYNGYTGRLPDAEARQLSYARPDYIVFSYDTPIAWHDSVTREWTVPDVKYSPTTTQHQHTVTVAVHNPPDVDDGSARQERADAGVWEADA